MALSITAKAVLGGSLGTITVGGPVATYAAWDHIQYYEVERKVIYRLVKLDRKSEETGGITITIEAKTEASSKENEKLSEGYFWFCEVTTPISKADYIWNKLKEKLPNSKNNEYLENKQSLVKACSGNRKK